MRQSNRPRNTVEDAEIDGVELRIRAGRTGLAVQAEAQLIDTPAECMRFVERKELPQGRLDESEPGNGIALSPRLDRFREVSAVETAQYVALTEDVSDIQTVLVTVDRCGRRANEARRPC